MALKYSCFISYRHAEGELHRRIIRDLFEALSEELELHVGEKIFLDEERLRGGFLYNEVIAEALCMSACMVLVYTPTYFDLEHSYCAREFRAMEALEEYRLNKIRNPGIHNRRAGDTRCLSWFSLPASPCCQAGGLLQCRRLSRRPSRIDRPHDSSIGATRVIAGQKQKE